jgi:hypothetical protein
VEWQKRRPVFTSPVCEKLEINHFPSFWQRSVISRGFEAWWECSSISSCSGLVDFMICSRKICLRCSCCWGGAVSVPDAPYWERYDDPGLACVLPQMTGDL